jgi:chromosome segregation ATPase
MLTAEDIKKLIEAEKEVFTTKEDFSDLKQSFSSLQTSVDGYSKKADTYFQEMTAMRNAIRRHEDAIKKIAEKTGVKLDF